MYQERDAKLYFTAANLQKMSAKLVQLDAGDKFVIKVSPRQTALL